MITTVHTSFSVYEIDQDAKRVRRLRGLDPQTAHQDRFSGDEGWAEYLSVAWCHDGLLFVWALEEGGSNEVVVRQTLTSPVVAMDGPPIPLVAEVP